MPNGAEYTTAEALNAAREYVSLGRRDEAERFYRLVANQRDDRPLSLNACFEAASLAANYGDMAGARQWMNLAAINASGWGDPEAAASASEQASSYDRMFTGGLFAPPRVTRPSMTPSQNAVGVTIPDLTSAIAAGQRRTPGWRAEPLVIELAAEDIHFGGADLNSPLEAHMFGTMVKDEFGRTGLRDETTGETILIDHNWDPAHIEQDLGNTVFVSGTLTGAGTDRKALKIATYAADKGYGKPFGPQEAAKGLRIIDHRAQTVVARAKPPAGPALG